MGDYQHKEKPKRGKRSCWRNLLYLFAGLFFCGVVTIIVLVILGPVIGERLMYPDPIYVEADYSIDVQGAAVTYHAPDYPSRGGVFENGLYFQAVNQTVDISIEDDIATINQSLTIRNAGNEVIDGVFIVPLPSENVLETVIVEINGLYTQITPYTLEEGRAYLQALAEDHNDLSLLAYTDKPFVEVDVFPLTETKTITVKYSHPTEINGGLVGLNVPLAFPVTVERPIEQFEVTVSASDESPLRNIYPATVDLMITQNEVNSFTGTANEIAYTAAQDFELYYAPSNEAVTANILTYRNSEDEDGYFLLMLEPAPLDTEAIVAKDVILVLDQSGSMEGVKWQQAQEATSFVLEHLNPNDRFFVTTFSSSYTFFDSQLATNVQSNEAIEWVNNRSAGGGTNINDALLETLHHADPQRPTTLIFMTDGQATEGTTDTQAILENLREAVGQNVRIFVFGVGNDVNTYLLDSIAQEFRGATGYVRQNETIDSEISTLYSKIASPVLTDIRVDFGDAVAGDFVPSGQLPDLFANQQLLLVGRYRRGGEAMAITLTGKVNGEEQSYTFDDLYFESERGGRAFVQQLWAARRIGEILNTIRLGSEDAELVDSIVALSLRYGIITPYTEFLLEQDDVLTGAGQVAANTQMMVNARNLQQNQTGAYAVDTADMLNQLSSSRNYVPTQSYSSYGSGYSSGFGRQQYITVTATPLPDIEQNGLILTIKQAESKDSSDYVLSLDEDGFDRALFVLGNLGYVEERYDLPVLISDLVNAYGIERGVEVYNETFGVFLPLVPIGDARVDGNYVIAPEAPIQEPPLRTMHEKAFILQEGVYTDTTFAPDTMQAEMISSSSEAYQTLVASHLELLPYLSVGRPIIIVWDGAAYEIRNE